MRTNVQQALQRARLRASRQDPITICWVEHLDNAEVADQTTGAMDSVGVTRMCETRMYFTRFVPATSAYRANAEVEAGDCVLDILCKLYRINEPGDSDLTQGDAVDEITYNSVNRALPAGSETALGYEIKLSEMGPPVWVIIDGEGWVQKQIGASLRATWDSAPLGIKTCQTILLRRDPSYDHFVLGDDGDAVEIAGGETLRMQ